MVSALMIWGGVMGASTGDVGERAFCGFIALVGIPLLYFAYRAYSVFYRQPELVEEPGDKPEPSPEEAASGKGRRWDASGVDSDLDRGLRNALWPLALGAFMVWNPLRLAHPHPRDGVFRGLGVLVLLWGLFQLVGLPRILRFGRSRLRFERFPFVLGESLRVVLERFERLRGARRLEIALLCYKELPSDQEPRRSRGTLTFVVYEDRRTFESVWEALAAAGSGTTRDGLAANELALEFPLPAEPQWSTRLSVAPCHYWELEVKADLPGIDYRAHFLLPVYSRRA
jgi:hypothetical protein